jgi:4,5-dihydroxyphthalate decarboxylase
MAPATAAEGRPQEGTTTLSVVLGDYPHTRPLKDGSIPVQGADCRFPHAAPLYSAFARMVRNLEFDVCEMALATYFQAREAGVPVTLLPVAMIGGTHHQSLTRLPGGPALSPRQLAGRRVGVRSYSQTTGLWVRGILREDYGVDPADITWVTTEEPHVAGYREPASVHRSRAAKVADLLRDGDVEAAVLGPRAIGAQGLDLVPVVEDAQAAGQAWIDRHRTIPVNHMVVVRDEVLESEPHAVAALFRAMAESIAATAGERDGSPAGRVVSAGWTPELVRSVEIAAAYALDQQVVRSRIDVGRIAGHTAHFDAPAAGAGQRHPGAEVRPA